MAKVSRSRRSSETGSEKRRLPQHKRPRWRWAMRSCNCVLKAPARSADQREPPVSDAVDASNHASPLASERSVRGFLNGEPDPAAAEPNVSEMLRAAPKLFSAATTASTDEKLELLAQLANAKMKRTDCDHNPHRPIAACHDLVLLFGRGNGRSTTRVLSNLNVKRRSGAGICGEEADATHPS